MTTTAIAVGDTIEIVRPDPEHGNGCIAAGYDAAYLVTAVDDDQVWAETRLPFLRDPIAFGHGEVKKSRRRPWWEPQ